MLRRVQCQMRVHCAMIACAPRDARPRCRRARQTLLTRTAVAVLVRDAAGRVLLTQRAPDGLLAD